MNTPEIEKENTKRLMFNGDLKADIVRCTDCIYKDTDMCRTARVIKHSLDTDKRVWRTMMEPDGFCSVGERHFTN